MWVTQIRWAAAQVVAAHVTLGSRISDAKRSLPHGQFARLLNSPNMPFGVRQSQKLVKIATHPALGDGSDNWRLPVAVDSLCILAGVAPAEVRRGLTTGQVHHRMTISEAKQFADAHPHPYTVRHIRRRRRRPCQPSVAALPGTAHGNPPLPPNKECLQ